MNLIVLTKQGSGEVLTQIMPFINPRSHERHHSSNMLAYEVIIFMDDSNSKHFKGEKRWSHDAMQSSHGHSV